MKKTNINYLTRSSGTIILAFIGCVLLFTGEALAQCGNTLQVTGLAVADQFGGSVSVNGDVAIAGARLHELPGPLTNSGAAWIFRRNGSTWSQDQKLQGLDTVAYDSFGHAVAIEGNVAVVVASGAYTSGVNTGATYIFRDNGSSWVQEQRLPVGVNGTGSGSAASVSISGDTIVIGNGKDSSRGFSYTNAGAAYVYRYHSERPAGDRWTIESSKRNGVLEPRLSAINAAAGDYLGYSVAISGDLIVAGAYGDGSLSGAAYVFARNDNGTSSINDDFWEQKQKIVPADSQSNDQFGYSVAIDANNIVIGANADSTTAAGFGSAYVFSLAGSTWVQQAELFGSSSSVNGFFGYSVSIAGDSVAVGAPFETPFWTKGGSTYLFRKTGSTWATNTRQRLEEPNAYGNNNFGYSVSASSSAIFAGGINTAGTGAGTIFNASCLGIGALAPEISLSSLPNGFVDALEDRDAASGNPLGIRDISITFSTPVKNASNGAALSVANFERKYFRSGAEITQAPYDLATGTAPTVTLVSGTGAGPYHLSFSPRIPLGAWTKITAVNVVDAVSGTPISTSENKVVLGNLPMDLTQDGKVLGDDINRWLAIKNGTFTPPPPFVSPFLEFMDQKRNGVFAGEDLTRAIQLINGIGTLRVWNGFDMGARP